MHDSLTPAATRELLKAVSQHIVDSVDLLTTVDQAIGVGGGEKARVDGASSVRWLICI